MIRYLAFIGLLAFMPLSQQALAQSPDLQHHLLPPRILGDYNAPVVIEEFSSLTCPHCASFHRDILPQLEEDFIEEDKVKLIYYDFPLDNRAEVAALLARCVEPELFHPMINLLFKQQERWARSDEFIKTMRRYGQLSGMKDDEIDACFNNIDLMRAILEVKRRAIELYQINSTPSFLINGERVDFASYGELSDHIRDLLE